MKIHNNTLRTCNNTHIHRKQFVDNNVTRNPSEFSKKGSMGSKIYFQAAERIANSDKQFESSLKKLKENLKNFPEDYKREILLLAKINKQNGFAARKMQLTSGLINAINNSGKIYSPCGQYITVKSFLNVLNENFENGNGDIILDFAQSLLDFKNPDSKNFKRSAKVEELIKILEIIGYGSNSDISVRINFFNELLNIINSKCNYPTLSDIANILDQVKSDNSVVLDTKLKFIKELYKIDEYKSINLYGFEVPKMLHHFYGDDPKNTKTKMDFALDLLKDDNFSIDAHLASDIASCFGRSSEQDLKLKIDFVKELIQKNLPKNPNFNGMNILVISQFIDGNIDIFDEKANFVRWLVDLTDPESQDYIGNPNANINMQFLFGMFSKNSEIIKMQTNLAKRLISMMIPNNRLYSKDVELVDIGMMLSSLNCERSFEAENRLKFLNGLLEYLDPQSPYYNRSCDFMDILDSYYDLNTTSVYYLEQKDILKKELFEMTNEKSENYNPNIRPEYIEPILLCLSGNSKKVIDAKIKFAKELIETINPKSPLYNKKMDMPKIREILRNFYSPPSAKIIEDKANFVRYILNPKGQGENEPFNQDLAFECLGLILSYITGREGEVEQKISFAKELLKLKDNNGKFYISPELLSGLLNRGGASARDVDKLFNMIGEDFYKFNVGDIIKAGKIINLCGIKKVEDIPLSKKRSVIKQFSEYSCDLYNTSEIFQKYFPLVPRNPEEYCEFLPILASSLCADIKPLEKMKVEKFNTACRNLGENLSKLSDDEFNSLNFSQEYSKSDLINYLDSFNYDDRQEIFNFYNFSLENIKSHAKNGEAVITTFFGYPNLDNFDEKIKDIKDKKAEQLILKTKPSIEKFVTCKINCQNEQIRNDLQTIMDIIPELRTTIGKVQHATQDFDVLKHSLKVMQKIVQNKEFNNLNESDKKIMLTASLMHDITKLEGNVDEVHADESAFDTYYLTKKFSMSDEEETKLFSLVKNHEWLKFIDENGESACKTVAFKMQYDNLFDMAKIFTEADLKAVYSNDGFYENHKDNFNKSNVAIQKYIRELKITQPLLPVTKVPKASRIKQAITSVDSITGKTNLKGIYVNRKGLVIIKFNEVENETWEKIGFPKGSVSSGINYENDFEKINTGNIKFFVHGLEFPDQLAKFNAFKIPDSDALLSVSYTECPEAKYKFYERQGVVLNTDNKYVYGGGHSNSGSGTGKNIQNFIDNCAYVGCTRYQDRVIVSDLVKETLELKRLNRGEWEESSNEEYLKFLNENKNKSFAEMDKEKAEKIIKAFTILNPVNQDYNEMYISKPEVMATFACMPTNNVKKGLMELIDGYEFLKDYSIKNDIPMIVFGN